MGGYAVVLPGQYDNFGAATQVSCSWWPVSSRTCTWNSCNGVGEVVTAGASVRCISPVFPASFANKQLRLTVRVFSHSNTGSNTYSYGPRLWNSWTAGDFVQITVSDASGCSSAVNCSNTTSSRCPPSMLSALQILGASNSSRPDYTLVTGRGKAECTGGDLYGEPTLALLWNPATCMAYRGFVPVNSLVQNGCAGIRCTNGQCTFNATRLNNDIVAVLNSFLIPCNFLCASRSCVGIPTNTLVSSVSYKCGDGIVFSSFEECDDGNTLDNDGCSRFCMRETCE
jgi:cysteine-rich repeat protein